MIDTLRLLIIDVVDVKATTLIVILAGATPSFIVNNPVLLSIVISAEPPEDIETVVLSTSSPTAKHSYCWVDPSITSEGPII